MLGIDLTRAPFSGGARGLLEDLLRLVAHVVGQVHRLAVGPRSATPAARPAGRRGPGAAPVALVEEPAEQVVAEAAEPAEQRFERRSLPGAELRIVLPAYVDRPALSVLHHRHATSATAGDQRAFQC